MLAQRARMPFGGNDDQSGNSNRAHHASRGSDHVSKNMHEPSGLDAPGHFKRPSKIKIWIKVDSLMLEITGFFVTQIPRELLHAKNVGEASVLCFCDAR
jgi:hypothetical protein